MKPLTKHDVLERLALGQVLKRMAHPVTRRPLVCFDGDYTAAVPDQVLIDLLDAKLIEAQRGERGWDDARYIRTGVTAAPPPPRARRTDPAPAQLTAVALDISASHREVLQLFRVYGAMNLQQLVETAKADAQRHDRRPYSDSRYRSAVAELRALGLMHSVGTGPTGHFTKKGVATNATHWDLTDEGRRIVGGALAGSPRGDA